jgi:hypothetical protein
VIAVRKSATRPPASDDIPQPVVESPVSANPSQGDDYQERASCGISETDSLDDAEHTQDNDVDEAPVTVLPAMYDLVHSPFGLPPGLLHFDASEFQRFFS